VRTHGHPSTLLLLAVVTLALALTAPASADRRYFAAIRTPHLDSAGTLEMETYVTASSGQGDSTNTAWQDRVEFEYALSDRVTGSFNLNFSQAGAPEAPLRFEGPSLELIAALAEPGRMPLDPALYLEARENGAELELESKLLLAQRAGGLIIGTNVVGELESVHAPAPGAPRTAKAIALTAGIGHEASAAFAFALEGVYRRRFSERGADAQALFAGPTINLQSAKMQLTLGWQPQVWGTPSPGQRLDLGDFARSEVRLVLGIDL
jgi:hypothetical protein